jgi:carboxymethylenebutenolidase
LSDKVIRSLLLLAITAVLACQCFAANGKQVTYKSGERTAHAVLYAPEAKGKLPAIVVLHNWLGLTPWAKQQASRLADLGYVTLAVDMYDGKVAANADEAQKMAAMALDEQSGRDLVAAADYLRSLSNVDATRIGALGWSLGGWNTMRLAMLDPMLKAAVMFYGGPETDAQKLSSVHAAMLGLFGAKDPWIKLDSIAAFEKNMRQAGKVVQVKIYRDAGHNFDNETADTFRAEDALDAWKLTAEFLKKNL